jgi:hypothetical protein
MTNITQSNQASDMDFNTSIHIDNVVVSTNLQGVVRAVPVNLLAKQGIDHSNVPRMTYGSRLVDNAMIQSLLLGEISFDDAMNRGTPV